VDAARTFQVGDWVRFRYKRHIWGQITYISTTFPGSFRFRSPGQDHTGFSINSVSIEHFTPTEEQIAEWRLAELAR
jgi:hypothetical protein